VTFILKHIRARRNPFLRFSVITVPKLYQNPGNQGMFAPRQLSFRWLGGLAARGLRASSPTSSVNIF